jgi:hypothetical protein
LRNLHRLVWSLIAGHITLFLNIFYSICQCIHLHTKCHHNIIGLVIIYLVWGITIINHKNCQSKKMYSTFCRFGYLYDFQTKSGSRWWQSAVTSIYCFCTISVQEEQTWQILQEIDWRRFSKQLKIGSVKETKSIK